MFYMKCFTGGGAIHEADCNGHTGSTAERADKSGALQDIAFGRFLSGGHSRHAGETWRAPAPRIAVNRRAIDNPATTADSIHSGTRPAVHSS